MAGRSAEIVVSIGGAPSAIDAAAGLRSVTARGHLRGGSKRPPERYVVDGAPRRSQLRYLRYRFSPQQLFAELFQKRWMEPAVPLALLIGIIAYFTATTPHFMTSANALSTGREMSEFVFIALGMGVVVISGGIDLSVGSMFALANMFALIMVSIVGLPVWLALAATLAFGAALGSINGVIVAYLKARPFLTTLVTLIIFRGVLNLLDLRYSTRMARSRIDDPLWEWLGRGEVLGIPSAFVVLMLTLILGHVVLSRSRLGWHITAVGSNRRAARHAGIRVERVLLTSYMFSGLMCALASVFYAPRLSSASVRVGEGMELAILTAVVLGGISLSGGRGTVWRVLIGAAAVVLLGKGLLQSNVHGSVYQTVLAGVLITAVGIDIKWAKNRGKAIQKSYVNPTLIEYPDAPDMSSGAAGPFAMNDRLSTAEAIGLGEVEGPEDVIIDRQGRLYCGDRRGWILRFSGPDLATREVFARIGGHPLGLAFDADENLIVCVGGMGVYGVRPDGEVFKVTDETNRTWTQLRDDSRLRLPDDLDLTPDGAIWFSEATNRFEMHDWILDGIEGRPNGRLVRHDPATGTTKTVLRGLVFPNGVCTSHDGESLLIAQTWLCRILRYWHTGAKRGKVEVFMDNLPAYLDNINRASDGNYWVALNGMRSPAYDLAMRKPAFRRRMMKRLPRDEWLYPNMNYGVVVKVDESGSVIETLGDPGGRSHASITSMREHDGYLYIGGLENNRIGRIQVAPSRDTTEEAESFEDAARASTIAGIA